MQCSKCGENSTAIDYCDQCGTRLGASAVAPTTAGSGASASSAPPAPAAPVGDPPMVPSATQLPRAGTCSNCGSPRDVGESFCEVCGYDYQTGELPNLPAPLVSVPVTPGSPTTPTRAWDLAVRVDPKRWEEFAHLRSPDGPVPSATSIALITGSVMIGRLSRSQNVNPDVDLRALTQDPAVSARHARLDLRQGTWELVDLGSDNGTVCDDVSLEANRPVPVVSGSTIRVGAWTICTLTSR
jgi:hypothetical protein